MSTDNPNTATQTPSSVHIPPGLSFFSPTHSESPAATLALSSSADSLASAQQTEQQMQMQMPHITPTSSHTNDNTELFNVALVDQDDGETGIRNGSEAVVMQTDNAEVKVFEQQVQVQVEVANESVEVTISPQVNETNKESDIQKQKSDSETVSEEGALATTDTLEIRMVSAHEVNAENPQLKTPANDPHDDHRAVPSELTHESAPSTSSISIAEAELEQIAGDIALAVVTEAVNRSDQIPPSVEIPAVAAAILETEVPASASTSEVTAVVAALLDASSLSPSDATHSNNTLSLVAPASPPVSATNTLAVSGLSLSVTAASLSPAPSPASSPSTVSAASMSSPPRDLPKCGVSECNSRCYRDEKHCLNHYKLFKEEKVNGAPEDVISMAFTDKKEANKKKHSLISCGDGLLSPSSVGNTLNVNTTSPLTSPASSSASISSTSTPGRPTSPVHISKSPSALRPDPFLDEVRAAWRAADRVVFKDLPRLAKRITIIDDSHGCIVRSGKRVFGLPLVSSGSVSDATKKASDGKDNDEKSSADISSYLAVSNVITAVADHLESSDRAASVRQMLLKRRVEGEATGADLEGILSDVMKSTLSASSTFGVFRAIHQSILFPAIFRMKTQVFSALADPMKDVRRPDGWTVEIYLGEAISVTHVRCEESVVGASQKSLSPSTNAPNGANGAHAPISLNERFECRWQLRMTFDKLLQELRSATVRVLEVIANEKMSAADRDKLRSVLTDDLIL